MATVLAICWLLLQLGADLASLCSFSSSSSSSSSFSSSFLRNLSSSSLVLFFPPYKSLCSRSKIIRSSSNLCSSSCSFISFSFFLDLIITSYRCIGQNSPEKLKQRKLFEPQKLVMVLKTVWSNHGSHGSLLFSHRAVIEAKKTAKLRGLRFLWSNHTVQAGFQNHACISKYLVD